MSLSKFSARLSYTSKEGCEYKTAFIQNPKNTEANDVLLDAIEHLAWMGAIAFDTDQAKEAFNRGFNAGKKRQKELQEHK